MPQDDVYREGGEHADEREAAVKEYISKLRTRHSEQLGISEESYQEMSFKEIEELLDIKISSWRKPKFDDIGGYFVGSKLYGYESEEEERKREKEVDEILEKY